MKRLRLSETTEKLSITVTTFDRLKTFWYGAHFVVALVVIAAWSTTYCRQMLLGADAYPKEKIQQRILERQLTVAFSVNGRFATGYPWNLSINSAGQAELTISTRPEETRMQLQIDKEKIAQLRKAIVEEDMFSLDAEYGQETVSGHLIVMTIVAGDVVKTIRMRNMALPHPDTERKQLQGTARAVRVAKVIIGMIDDDRAVKLRAYFESVIKSSERK